ncbi:MAG: transporter substrate-binding domain-containing protein [Clostridiales bacterium]|nr:transporter substrate-binding domain-containing protein [Clostridiales bacterium]
MKKFTKVLALLFAALFAMGAFSACSAETATTDSDLEYVQEKATLVIGITEYEPMNYYEDGELTGFDTEFAMAVCEKLGVEAQFVEINWDTKFTELSAKSIDCIWNGMTITDEAKEAASISNAYAENAQVVVMKESNLDSYTTAESLADLVIAVEGGSAGEQAAESAGLENIVVSNTQALALTEVSSGSADACIIDLTMANAMTGEGTSNATLGYSIKLEAEEYGIAFRQGSDLTEKVNEIIAELMEDGTLDELAEKYEITLIK